MHQVKYLIIDRMIIVKFLQPKKRNTPPFLSIVPCTESTGRDQDVGARVEAPGTGGSG